MSGQPAACITGVTLGDPTLCPILNEASTTPLSGPTVEAPVSVQNDMLPVPLQNAINTGSPLIGYNFETAANPVRADRVQYTVDTYTNVIQNSAVLVKKPEKVTGTLSGVAGPDSTGKSTATVTYTVSGTPYTFTGSWDRTVTNGETVDVYYNPNDVSRGSLDIEGTGVVPPLMTTTPGYELIDFQAATTTGGNLLLAPTVTTVDECADRCDDTPNCTGFNFGGLDTSTVCELVRDATTTREYVDQKVGFVKETIPGRSSGTNPLGTDLTNQGAYCEDAPACNRDIARVINENDSASDPIASFSTSDIDSCAYCPVRKYNRAGHVTTNEVGVSKGNASPADAITELQYQTDGTFPDHNLVIQAGKFYKIASHFESFVVFTVASGEGFKLFTLGSNKRIVTGYPQFEVPMFGFLSKEDLSRIYSYSDLISEVLANGQLGSSGDRLGEGSILTDQLYNLTDYLSFRKWPMTNHPSGTPYGTPDTFTFTQVPFVREGFRIVSSDGKALSNDRRFTKIEYTFFSRDSVFQVSQSNHYEFVNQVDPLEYPGYPGTLIKDGQYVKINSNGTAEVVPSGLYPWTSRISTSFRFCRINYAVSFDFSSFDWSGNWFTQSGPATCEEYVNIVYRYEYVLSPFDTPGFWNDITTVCTNNCPAGTYVTPCTSTPSSTRTCMQCSPGSYCPQLSESEQPCPANYYCPTPASQIQCSILSGIRSCPNGYVVQNVPGGGCEGSHSATNNRTIDTSYTCVFQTCPVNNILVGSSCQPCLNGGTSVGTESSCYCRNGWSGSRCETCSANKYISGSSCLSCPASSSSSQNSTRCSCNNGYAWTGANWTLGAIPWAYTADPIDFTGGRLLSPPTLPGGSGSTWQYTPLPTTTGTSAICAFCKQDYWETLCNGTAPAEGLTKTCGIGRNQCVLCQPGQGRDAQGTCVACGSNPPLGQVWKPDSQNIGGYVCDYDQCPIPQPGYIWGTSKTSCSPQACLITPSPGYIWANDGINCIRRCPANYYCPNATTSIQCPAGYTSGGGPQTIISTPASSVADCFPCLSSGQICTTCPTSTPYFNLGLNRCVYCFFNSSCTGGKKCIQGTCQCPEYAPYDTGTTCVQCTTNSHCPSGSCVNNLCEVDAYSYSCPDTQITYRGRSSGSMVAPTVYKTVGLIGTRCRTNETTPLTGFCGNGVSSTLKYDLLDGQCSMPALVTCRAGYYASTDWRGVYNQCLPCFAGFYCPTIGLIQQYQCPAGTYCPDGRMITPLQCPAGFYCPTALTTTPTTCPVNSYSTEGSTICRCPSNYEWAGSECYACPAGATAPGRTATGTPAYCLCPVNTRWNVSACVACGSNSYRDRQSSAAGTESYCTCTLGYKWSGTACVACPANSSIYMTVFAFGSASQCTCAANYKWSGTACVACPTNATASGLTASGSASQCRCATNYRWSGTACVACPAGGTAPGRTASGYANYCSICDTNTRWSGTTCVACPTNATASGLTASGSANYCTCATNYKWSGTTCVACPTNATASGLKASGYASQCRCATNYRWSGTACVACPAGGTSSGLTASGSANYCT